VGAPGGGEGEGEGEGGCLGLGKGKAAAVFTARARGAGRRLRPRQPRRLALTRPTLHRRSPRRPPAAPAKKKDKILTMDPAEITYEMVNRKMREIISTRGRRGVDKQEQVRGD
jgi:hypothetical protein